MTNAGRKHTVMESYVTYERHVFVQKLTEQLTS